MQHHVAGRDRIFKFENTLSNNQEALRISNWTCSHSRFVSAMKRFIFPTLNYNLTLKRSALELSCLRCCSQAALRSEPSRRREAYRWFADFGRESSNMEYSGTFRKSRSKYKQMSPKMAPEQRIVCSMSRFRWEARMITFSLWSKVLSGTRSRRAGLCGDVLDQVPGVDTYRDEISVDNLFPIQKEMHSLHWMMFHQRFDEVQ